MIVLLRPGWPREKLGPSERTRQVPTQFLPFSRPRMIVSF